MKYIILALFSVFSINNLQSQSLKVSAVASTQNNDTNQFTVGGNQIPINNEMVGFEEGAEVSGITDSGISVILSDNGLSVYEKDGQKINEVNYKGVNDDNSINVYVSNNGAFAVRENIANFLFFDSSGKIAQSVSNSSQSREGESVSEFAADPAWKTVVLYNPEILSNGQKGSRARIVKKNGMTSDIYNSRERAIRNVTVTDNGQYIAIATFKNDTDDKVIVTDRFGNRLAGISFDQVIHGVNISDDGRYITIYSNARAAVYSILNGKRLGSASFRSWLHFADYIPEDNMIIGLTGDESNSKLTNIELHAVNISARSIERRELDKDLGITDLISLRLTREGKYQYVLSGLSQKLHIRVSS